MRGLPRLTGLFKSRPERHEGLVINGSVGVTRLELSSKRHEPRHEPRSDERHLPTRSAKSEQACVYIQAISEISSVS